MDLGRKQGTQPSPRARGLSREGIVAAAVALADSEGAEAVSMRRIARDLRVGAMSLYWYVSSTAELHQAMTEQVQAESEMPEPSGDWRADLRRYAATAREALLRHPWAIDFLGAGPPSGPQDARNADRLAGAFEGTGADAKATMWAAMTLGTYVMGAALREVQETRWRQAGYAAEAASGFDPDAPEARDERFEFGLGIVLDGIEARFSASACPPRSS